VKRLTTRVCVLSSHRIAEFQSLAEMCGAERNVELEPLPGDVAESPYYFVDLPSEDVAREICARALLVRGIIDLWGYGDDLESLKAALKACPSERKAKYLAADARFKVEVEDFGMKGGSKHLVQRVEALELPFTGKVDLKSPRDLFWSMHSDVEASTGLPMTPKRMFFGRVVGKSDRTIVNKYDLKQRLYLGPTSMDAEMSLLMANMVRARPGGVVLDPFCGTGSLLIGAAHYGALTMGLDIDIRVIKHGKSANVPKGKDSKFGETAKDGSTVNVWTNFQQYNLTPPVALIRGDLHALPTRTFGLEGTLQGIIADPPYGVRAGGRKSGGRKPLADDYKIPEELLGAHIPSTAPYPFGECLDDLMDLAARFLSIGGLICFFVPGESGDPDPERELPTHPALRLRWHCLETFNTIWGRRLVTYEKVAPFDIDAARKSRAEAEAARASSTQPDLIERMRALVYATDRKRSRFDQRFKGFSPDEIKVLQTQTRERKSATSSSSPSTTVP
jgi:tRNA (guanine10-N2)-methyltransferase